MADTENIEGDAPPTYEDALKSGKQKARNGIPPEHRRSMEDERRPLPKGWVRSFDPEQGHQFFVDTRQDPPRSIWHHPYDDDEYLNSLPTDERDRIQSLHNSPHHKDVVAESTDEEEEQHRAGVGSSHVGELPPRPSSSEKPSFGRKWKDRLTQSTHEERVAQRKKRAEEERQAYEAHLAFRQAMQQAIQTGQPQLVGKDRNGKDVYIEPPGGVGAPYGARGLNPYSQGPYTNPNARFIRAPDPYYGRPYGYGYGGGYGLPLAGGLAGGLLLGGLLGGF